MNKGILLFFSACFLIFASTGCGNSPNDDLSASIYYYSRYDEGNRMHIQDGNDILFSLQLEYNSAPKGTNDGDSGKNLHLSISDPQILEVGKSYQLPHPAIKAVVSEWASPAAFKLNRGIKGEISIKKISPYQSIVLGLDLKLQTGLNEYQDYSLGAVRFDVNRLDRAYGQEITDLESHDGSYKKGSLQVSDFNGKWLQTAEVFYNKATGWRTYFHISHPLKWNFENAKLNQLTTTIKINQGRLLFKDQDGIDQFYAINHFSKDSLVVTNLNSNTHNRYSFKKQEE